MSDNFGNSDPIPVAEQKAAGVPPEETVTVADQKAGANPPPQVRNDDNVVYNPDRETAERGESKLPSTHYLHLIDGRVIEAQGAMTHYKDIPVVGAYPIPQEIAQQAHDF